VLAGHDISLRIINIHMYYDAVYCLYEYYISGNNYVGDLECLHIFDVRIRLCLYLEIMELLSAIGLCDAFYEHHEGCISVGE
jgi:hypothetical protein